MSVFRFFVSSHSAMFEYELVFQIKRCLFFPTAVRRTLRPSSCIPHTTLPSSTSRPSNSTLDSAQSTSTVTSPTARHSITARAVPLTAVDWLTVFIGPFGLRWLIGPWRRDVNSSVNNTYFIGNGTKCDFFFFQPASASLSCKKKKKRERERKRENGKKRGLCPCVCVCVREYVRACVSVCVYVCVCV